MSQHLRVPSAEGYSEGAVERCEPEILRPGAKGVWHKRIRDGKAVAYWLEK